jgi:hypothetical protein
MLYCRGTGFTSSDSSGHINPALWVFRENGRLKCDNTESREQAREQHRPQWVADAGIVLRLQVVEVKRFLLARCDCRRRRPGCLLVPSSAVPVEFAATSNARMHSINFKTNSNRPKDAKPAPLGGSCWINLARNRFAARCSAVVRAHRRSSGSVISGGRTEPRVFYPCKVQRPIAGALTRTPAMMCHTDVHMHRPYAESCWDVASVRAGTRVPKEMVGNESRR